MLEKRSAIVIGAGIAGLQASLELANNGFEVSLIERTSQVGGNVNRLFRLFPTLRSAEEAIKSLTEKVTSNPSIKIFTNCEVEGVQGSIGNFKVKITGQKREGIEADVVIVATGFREYDARKVGQYKYGQYKNVMTGLEYEQLCSPSGPTKGKIVRMDNEEKPKSVVFVLCVGSRDEKYLRYCCNIGCLNAIKHAHYLREQYGKEVDAYVCYTDIRAVTKHGEQLYQKVRADEVEFIHGQPSEIRESSDGSLTLDVYDQSTSKLLSITADLVVLETGLQPQIDLHERLGLPLDQDGFIAEKNQQLATNETSKEGVFLAGAVQQPMHVYEALTSASAAAMKAISSMRKR